MVRGEQKEYNEAVIKFEVLALTRTLKSDIDVALSCDVDGIITFIGSSDLHLKYKLKMTEKKPLKSSRSS